MSVGTHVDADVILAAKTLDAMLSAERARVRESEVAPLVALLRRALPTFAGDAAFDEDEWDALEADMRAAIKAHEERGR